jgi:hypothetical protein
VAVQPGQRSTILTVMAPPRHGLGTALVAPTHRTVNIVPQILPPAHSPSLAAAIILPLSWFP